MKDSISKTTSGKYFFYQTFFLPEFNKTETLLLSWIISRGMSIHTKRQEEIRLEHERQYGFEVVYNSKPIDEWWVSCPDKVIHKRIPHLSLPLIRKTILSLKEKKVITTRVFQPKRKDGKSINIRHVRVDTKHLHHRAMDWNPSNAFDLSLYTKIRLVKKTHEYASIKIYTDLVHLFESVEELLLYHWILNWHEWTKQDMAWHSVKSIETALQIGKDGQSTAIKALQSRGLLSVTHGKNGLTTPRLLGTIPIDTKQATGIATKPTTGIATIPATIKEDRKEHKNTRRLTADENAVSHNEVRMSKLRNAVRNTLLVRRSFSKTSWTKEFAILEKQLGVNAHLLDEVLDWYCRNIKTPFVPVCESAKTFRIKFDRIRQAMERTVDKTVEISQEAKDIAASLSRLGWPGKAKDNLPFAVQESLANFNEWKKMMNSFPEPQSPFYIKLKGSYSSNPKTFLSKWFQDIHARKTWSGKWNGEFGKLDIFHHSHPDFQQTGKTLSTLFSGRTKAWDDFYSIITSSK